MKLGVIADDFTGASDIGLTLAEAGMTVTQFVGVPTAPAAAGLDAGVVALKTRTAPVEHAVAASLAACDWLLAQGAGQIIFKVCSTFDSTPQGNIGPVLDALADRLGAGAVIVCPAFPENGRSVYQGHLFVADRLLNECGMQDHPLTPMTDPDLRRVLAAQSRRDVGHIPAETVRRGADAIRQALTTPAHLIADAITDADLVALGQAGRDLPLICGGSGIALGLPSNFGLSAAPPDWQPVSGPGVVLSGSCSVATRKQVETFAAKAPSMQIDVARVVAGEVSAQAIANWAMEQPTAPLVYSSADPAEVKAAQAKFGKDTVAAAVEDLFARLGTALAGRGATRMVVAGGETSGAVVTGLGAGALQIGPRAAAGVPLLRAGSLALALKSGNFGGPNFFAETLALMGTAP